MQGGIIDHLYQGCGLDQFSFESGVFESESESKLNYSSPNPSPIIVAQNQVFLHVYGYLSNLCL